MAQIIPAQIIGEHVLLTGPITGTVTKADGTVVDVSPIGIEVADQDEADEIDFLIGQHWVEHGHPDDFDIDEKGNRIQRPFVWKPAPHVDPKKFDKHPAKFSGKPAGVAAKKG